MLSYRRYLHEIFNGKVSYVEDTHLQSAHRQVYRFEINGLDYMVDFTKDSYPDHDAHTYIHQWDLTFLMLQHLPDGNTKMKTRLTGTGNAFEVFATVAEITKAFVREVKPHELVFTASASEPTRVNLYTKMAPLLAKAIGYKLATRETNPVSFRYPEYDSVKEFMLISPQRPR